MIDSQPKIKSRIDNKEYETEIEERRVFKAKLSDENEAAAFALLRGPDWIFYLKKTVCIIGRAPRKSNSESPVRTFWEVDLDLGDGRKISKQHGAICYNFFAESFEIVNLSKKFPIKVNGESLKYWDYMPLTNRSIIQIGHAEFLFLLPMFKD